MRSECRVHDQVMSGLLEQTEGREIYDSTFYLAFSFLRIFHIL